MLQTLNSPGDMTTPIMALQGKPTTQALRFSIESTSIGRSSGFDDSPFSLSQFNTSSFRTSLVSSAFRSSTHSTGIQMGPSPTKLQGEPSTITAAAMVKSGDNVEIQRPGGRRDRDGGGSGRNSWKMAAPGELTAMPTMSLRPQMKMPFKPKSATSAETIVESTELKAPSVLNVGAPVFEPPGQKMQASAPAFTMPGSNGDAPRASLLWGTNTINEFVPLQFGFPPIFQGAQQEYYPKFADAYQQQEQTPPVQIDTVNSSFMSQMQMGAQMPFDGEPQQQLPALFQDKLTLNISSMLQPVEDKAPASTLNIFDMLNDRDEDVAAQPDAEASVARTSTGTPTPGWTLILVDENAFKEQTTIQSDLQKRLTSVRVKAFKTGAKCCRSLEKKTRLDQHLFLATADEAAHLSELFVKHPDTSIIVYGGMPELPFEYHYSEMSKLVDNIANLTGLVPRKESTIYGANFSVLWVDEQAFKAHGQIRKQQLEVLPGCIGVKTYKSADKAIRATSKKQCLKNTLIMASEHEANDLIKYLVTRDEPIPLIIECAAGSKWHSKEDYDAALIMVSTSWEDTHDNMASFAFEHMGAE
eukprot:GEMP01026625.1.p1 GENE.GEMP01026625.1~~GEMP01026625.1.p1  ORF type:complete len:585 (+),score=133.66 GEMP01026625.1:106-1860(+)